MKGIAMTAAEGDPTGHFYVGYDEGNAIFKAYISAPDRDAWVLAEVSRSLEDLLKTCRQRGLVNFAGLTPAAINRIHRWLVVERPALEYVERAWGDKGPSERGPIGFRLPIDDES